MTRKRQKVNGFSRKINDKTFTLFDTFELQTLFSIFWRMKKEFKGNK